MLTSLTAFTWFTYLSANVWLGAQSITAIMVIHSGEYSTKWAFLIAACMQLVALLVNVTWGKHMNTVETLSIILHLVALLMLTALLIFARATNTVASNFSITSDTGWSASLVLLWMLFMPQPYYLALTAQVTWLKILSTLADVFRDPCSGRLA